MSSDKHEPQDGSQVQGWTVHATGQGDGGGAGPVSAQAGGAGAQPDQRDGQGQGSHTVQQVQPVLGAIGSGGSWYTPDVKVSRGGIKFSGAGGASATKPGEDKPVTKVNLNAGVVYIPAGVTFTVSNNTVYMSGGGGGGMFSTEATLMHPDYPIVKGWIVHLMCALGRPVWTLRGFKVACIWCSVVQKDHKTGVWS